jgi:glycosyltransferase involved in cell wall biosynthesis
MTPAYKGGATVCEAVARLPSDIITALISVGGRGLPIRKEGLLYKHFGQIADATKIATLFRAADIYVHGSVEDNLPNTVCESLACGTPVIAFSAGGLPEMIEPDMTGWLVADKTPSGLTAAIVGTCQLGSERLVKIRENCRHSAETSFDIRRQASHYAGVYSRVRSTCPPLEKPTGAWGSVLC